MASSIPEYDNMSYTDLEQSIAAIDRRLSAISSSMSQTRERMDGGKVHLVHRETPIPASTPSRHVSFSQNPLYPVH